MSDKPTYFVSDLVPTLEDIKELSKKLPNPAMYKFQENVTWKILFHTSVLTFKLCKLDYEEALGATKVELYRWVYTGDVVIN